MPFHRGNHVSAAAFGSIFRAKEKTSDCFSQGKSAAGMFKKNDYSLYSQIVLVKKIKIFLKGLRKQIRLSTCLLMI